MLKVSKILDQYLFAPGRYLDVVGNIVGAEAAKNLLSKPEAKIGALTGIGLAIRFAAAGRTTRTLNGAWNATAVKSETEKNVGREKAHDAVIPPVLSR
jgi:hypothetical protein